MSNSLSEIFNTFLQPFVSMDVILFCDQPELFRSREVSVTGGSLAPSCGTQEYGIR